MTRQTELEDHLLNRPSRYDGPVESWRTAAQLATAITDEETAIATLRQATINLDEPLVRWLLRIAYERGWAEVIDEYTTHNPDKQPQADELWLLIHPSNN